MLAVVSFYDEQLNRDIKHNAALKKIICLEIWKYAPFLGVKSTFHEKDDF